MASGRIAIISLAAVAAWAASRGRIAGSVTRAARSRLGSIASLSHKAEAIGRRQRTARYARETSRSGRHVASSRRDQAGGAHAGSLVTGCELEEDPIPGYTDETGARHILL